MTCASIHFWYGANHKQTAYGVGHTIALEKASSAGKRTDTSSRKNALKEAYLYEAFAAHYITDLFCSGHCRVPRRKLHNGSYASAGNFLLQ